MCLRLRLRRVPQSIVFRFVTPGMEEFQGPKPNELHLHTPVTNITGAMVRTMWLHGEKDVDSKSNCHCILHDAVQVRVGLSSGQGITQVSILTRVARVAKDDVDT
jgi:hypothetical protein